MMYAGLDVDPVLDGIVDVEAFGLDLDLAAAAAFDLEVEFALVGEVVGQVGRDDEVGADEAKAYIGALGEGVQTVLFELFGRGVIGVGPKSMAEGNVAKSVEPDLTLCMRLIDSEEPYNEYEHAERDAFHGSSNSLFG